MNILQAIKRGLKTTDKLLMSLCLLTSLFGVLMVYSATYSSLEDGSLISRTALVMLLAVIVGAAMCIVISFIDYEIVLRFWMIIGGVCLLMMLLLFPFGKLFRIGNRQGNGLQGFKSGPRRLCAPDTGSCKRADS